MRGLNLVRELLLADLPLAIAFAVTAHSLRQTLISSAAPAGAAAPGWPVAALALALAVLLWAWIAGRRAGRPPTLARWRLLFTITILTGVVFVITVPGFRRHLAELMAGIACGVYGLMILAGHYLGRRLPRRPAALLDVVLFNLCLLLVLAELALRLFAALYPSPLLARVDSRLAQVVRNRHLQPGTLRHGFPVNDHGHYDEPFAPRPGERPVALIGDSFSASIVPHHYHYTTVAERELGGVPIYNFGMPAAGPHEYLYLLRHEVLAFDPKAVVISLFLGNDVHETAARYQNLSHPWLRSWLQGENLLIVQVPRRLAILAREGRAAPGGPVARVEPEATVGRRIDDLAELERVYPWLRDPAREKPTFRPPVYLDLELERAQRTMGAPKSAYRRLFETLAAMRELAGERPFLVLMIPDELQVEEELWQAVSARLDPQLRDRARPQRTIRGWLESEGIPYLDLLPIFRAIPPGADGSRHLYHLRDTHWNARGNRIAGEALADFLAPYVAETASP